MVNYDLRLWPDEILKKKCAPVKDFSKLEKIIPLFYESMLENSAIGIAAPQLGISERFFIAKIDGNPKVFVNPEIEDSSGFIRYSEGCLSLPGLNVLTLRRDYIHVKFYDEYNKLKSKILSGKDSVVFQHELDHLNGEMMFQQEDNYYSTGLKKI